MFNNLFVVFKKEFRSYFLSRMVWFVFVSFSLFMVTGFFLYPDAGNMPEAELLPFFKMQLNLLVFVIPALSIKIWSDEKKQGTIELILSLPISYMVLTIGKFLALWSLCGLMILSTCGTWLLYAWLCGVNNSVVLVNYLFLWLACGGLCALSMLASAFTEYPVSAYVVSLAVCLLIVMTNISDLILGGDATEVVILAGDSLSFRYNFLNLIAGRITLSGIFYFLSMIMLSLWANVVVIGWRRK